MNTLLDQLKSEHAALVGILNNVQKTGLSSRESKDLLIKAKTALLAHLTKEDKELYPVLKKAGALNEDIQRKLNNFAKDMEEITRFVLTFFDNIEKDKYNPLEYSKDLGRLMTLLTSRISREENVLYPMYDACLTD